MDIYSEFKLEYFNDMPALAASKPIALGEVGAAPTTEILSHQPRWADFMVVEQPRRFLQLSRVTKRDLSRTASANP